MTRRRAEQLALPIAEAPGRGAGGRLTLGDLAALASPRRQAAELRRRLDARAAELERARGASSGGRPRGR